MKTGDEPGSATSGAAAAPPLERAPTHTLLLLRDLHRSPQERAEALRDFVRWICGAHAWLPGRLFRALRRQGLLPFFGPGDVMNVFFLEVWRNPTVLGEAPLPSRSWLWWRIQDVLRRLERQHREPDLSKGGGTALLPGEASGPESVVLLRELEGALDAGLEWLESENPDQHRALLLKTEHGYAEVAEQMEVPVGTAKSLVKRARDRLRVRLGEHLGSPSRGGGRHA